MQSTSNTHVVHVVESFAAGCLHAIATICHSARDGIRHSIVHGLRSETPKNFLRLFPDDCCFYYLPMTREIRVTSDIQAIVQLVMLLKRIKPDVVHAHSSKAGVLGRFAAFVLGIPSAYTPHGYAFLRPDISLPARVCYKWIEWIFSHVTNRIVACGAEEYALALRMTNFSSKIIYIANAINCDHPPPPPPEKHGWFVNGHLWSVL